MGANTSISWCDFTFNPWEGCSKVSPGCAHCFAEARNHRYGMDNWGKGKPRRRTSAAYWKQPLAWNRLQETSGAVHHGGERPRVFCASLADWLDDEVPIEWLADLLKLIHDTPNLDWLLLTKRPWNWEPRLSLVNDHLSDQHYGEPRYELRCWVNEWLYIHNIQAMGPGPAHSNLWIGTSVENQEYADKRIPELKIPASIRFLSVEPMLGPVDLSSWLPNPESEQDTTAFHNFHNPQDGIHWVICGGESGKGYRPMQIEWAESLREQCRNAGVAYFFKQDAALKPGQRGRASDELWNTKEFPSL